MNPTGLTFRSATKDDLSSLVELLKGDAIAESREVSSNEDDSAYTEAFAAIADDPNNDLLVAEHNGAIVGFLQITLIPGLGRKGATRLQIETVRVAEEQRSQGVGSALMQHALEIGKQSGATLAQLTTDKRRGNAQRFYDRLGFEATHEGYKMAL